MSVIHLLLVVVVLTVLDSLASVSACPPPVDIKATLINDGRSIEFSWKKPTTNLKIDRYDFSINGQQKRTTELKYQIQTPQLRTSYKFEILTVCSPSFSEWVNVKIGPCQPPLDVKAALVNDGRGIEFSWKQPNTDPDNVNYYFYINGQRNTTNELKYSMNKPQFGTNTFDVGRVCSNGDDSARFTVQIGYIGEAVYATVGQASVNIGWTTTATINDNIDITQADRNLLVFSFINGDIFFYQNDYNGSIVYTGDLANKRISFDLKNVKKEDAGYFVDIKGTTDRGGQVLVILDKPTKPTITGGRESYVGRRLELSCDSTKTSKPDYYTPVLNYTWLINGSVPVNDARHQGRYTQRENKLIIKNITKEDKYHRFSCKASDKGQESEQSDTIELNPFYGPDMVNLRPYNRDNTIEVGKSFGPVNCTAECNPTCKFRWKFRKRGSTAPRKDVTKLTLDSSTLNIPQVNKTSDGEYRCVAKSQKTSISQATKDITLNVQFQAEIKNVAYSAKGRQPESSVGSVTVSENEDINLHCYTEANPKAKISWIYKSKQLAVNSSAESLVHNLGSSISCETSGKYTCKADNGIVSAVNRSMELRVQCRPKQNNLSPATNRYGSKINSIVNVSLSVIADPKPTHKWNTNTTGQVIEKPTVNMNSYTHQYEASVKIQRPSDFGNYCLNMTNELGSSQICFQIQPEGPPMAPTNFTVEDTLPEMINLTWISEFNGGREQIFYLEYKEKDDASDFTKINISDSGPGRERRVSVGSLKANVIYTFTLHSVNALGKSVVLTLEVKTKDYPIKEPIASNMTGILVGVIVGFVILVVVVIGLVLVLIKRRKGSKTKSPDGHRSDVVYSEVNKSENIQNPPNGATADAVYSEVKKPKKKQQSPSGPTADAVYSEVKKPKKKQQSSNGPNVEVLYSEVKKSDKNDNNGTEGACVYENASLLGPGKSQAAGNQKPANSGNANGMNDGRHVNQEGLIYVDVDVGGKNDEKKGKPVVHGEEDRTDYVSIDFTKKGTPP